MTINLQGTFLRRADLFWSSIFNGDFGISGGKQGWVAMTRQFNLVYYSMMVCVLMTSHMASASCWNASQIAEAKAREVDSMLMVSALRCRRTTVGFIERYNEFVVQSRPALIEANNVLREHFVDSAGSSKKALDAYDRFLTGMANRYGGGVAGLNCDDLNTLVTTAQSEGASVELLALVADRAAIVPVLDDAACAAPARSLIIANRADLPTLIPDMPTATQVAQAEAAATPPALTTDAAEPAAPAPETMSVGTAFAALDGPII